MKPTMTVNEVTRNWIRYRLLYKSPIEFSCVEIQSSVVELGKKESVWHTPEMYSREWRRIRESIRYGRDYGFTVEEFKKEGELIKWYRVTKS